MRIAIVTNFLYPDRVGGTELYCHQLANALLKQGHEVFWFAPNFGETETITTDSENNLRIVRFAGVAVKNTTAEQSFVAASFIKEMRQRAIPVAHFNEFGGFSGISEYMLQETKKAGITTVVTLHLAYYTCRAGTLRYGGKEICNGEIIPDRCGSCFIFSNATESESTNFFLTRVFNRLFNVMDKNNITLLPKIKRLFEGFKVHRSFVTALGDYADTIVSLTEWFRDVLILNGIPAAKVVYLPQAIPADIKIENKTAQAERKGYVFISRISREKGIIILLGAAKKLNKIAPGISIDLYGPMPIPMTKQTKYFLSEIKKLPNIHYKGVLKPGEVLPAIDRYKAALLPSHVAEMAPLVIMEANALKIPVIASDVPGSAELIRQYDCGLIFDYDSVDDLVDKILIIEKGERQFRFIEPFENDFDHIATKYIEIYNNRYAAIPA